MNDMNQMEETLANRWPALQRIPTAKKPTAITSLVVKNHNPDFAILFPPFAGLWVESKGHIKDSQWLPMLKSWPTWLKSRYKVVLTSTTRKQREQYGKVLKKIGIDYSELDVNPLWFQEATDLYLSCEPHLVHPVKTGSHELVNKFAFLAYSTLSEEEAKERFYAP
jgi:hypothetical protein